MTETTTPKTRTITLTDRRPVTITEHDWPILAQATDTDYRGDPSRYRQALSQGDIETWSLRVRQHADGRSLVYGTIDPSRFQASRGEWRGGELLDAGADLAAAIRRVGEAGHLPDAIIRACIADLPAETL